MIGVGESSRNVATGGLKVDRVVNQSDTTKAKSLLNRFALYTRWSQI
jgi:hypothetical protein